MSNIANNNKVIHTATVVRAGSTMIIPQNITLENAIEIIKRQIESDEKLIEVTRQVNVFPWEGALALKKAMIARFGVFLTQDKMTMFGPMPPQEQTINVGVNETTTVPWGLFQWPLAEKIPGTDKVKEVLETSVGDYKGRIVFQIRAVIKRKWEGELKKLLDETEKIAKAETLYKGKAVRIAFTDEDHETIALPEPEFMDLSGVKLDDIVYTKDLTEIIERYIMTPLRHTAACREAGIPLKRGVLAAGPYGTGKSLLAMAVGRVAVENDWTFLYIRNAAELPQAIRFAETYQPAVIFAEDIDRAVEGDERTEEIDTILNTLDGIDTKTQEIMVILTTNHLEVVNPAMRRPGRLDVVLNVVPPDAEAAQRLVRVYGRNLIPENVDLAKVGEALNGATPAVIREVVERAKLAAIGRTGRPDSMVLGADLEISAHLMQQQRKLLEARVEVPDHPAKGLITAVAAEVKTAVSEQLTAMDKRIDEIADRVGA